ncbi:hypothetical protein A5667_27395 [Mycolicibacterium fortuitum]|nr:hypothetical protein A5667_27395 [Mycolicibacterium fortuitum]
MGPMGTWKRLATAKNIRPAVATITRWITTTRPELTTLADLTAADARMLTLSDPDSRRLGSIRSLLRYCAEVPEEVVRELARQRSPRSDNAREPYTDAELEQICSVMRAIVREAQSRIRTHRALIADLRAGRLDSLCDDDPKRKLAVTLDHCERTGDLPRSKVTGAPSTDARRLVQGIGRGRPGLIALIHLTAPEAWALGVLLAALTGFNASVLNALPASHLLATGQDEPAVALVETNKPRRKASAKMTLPLTSGSSDGLKPSLKTPVGVYLTLLELTELTRKQLNADTAFAYYASTKKAGSYFRAGLPNSMGRIPGWIAPRLTGDTAVDELLSTISLDRLRKTRIEISRTPIGQSRSMHHHYLRRMKKVREEGYGIVHEALNDQVTKALARRQITVTPEPSEAEAEASSNDTVLGECSDFEHSPFDNNRPCRQAFFTCLDCVNARAFPRHLPAQLLVADRIRDLKVELPAETWIRRYAGPLAQLDDIFRFYTPAQINKARTEITDRDRQRVERLLQGDFDTP